MTPSQERALYVLDRPRWIEHAAPRLLQRLAHASDAELTAAWSRMSRELQVAVWELMPSSDRARIRSTRPG